MAEYYGSIRILCDHTAIPEIPFHPLIFCLRSLTAYHPPQLRLIDLLFIFRIQASIYATDRFRTDNLFYNLTPFISLGFDSAMVCSIDSVDKIPERRELSHRVTIQSRIFFQ